MNKLLTLGALVVVPLLALAQSKEIEVSPSDPYVIERALQEARLARLHGEATDVTITLTAGTYNILQPITLRPEDSHTHIEGSGEVVISGGVQITGWRKQQKKGSNIYEADLPLFNGRPLLFRQVWVNNTKATRARDVADFNKMSRILSVDKAKETIYVPKKSVAAISSASQAEMVLHEMWCVANLRIKEVTPMGDSCALTFHQPESHVHFMHPWPSPVISKSGNSPFYLTGAVELLDQPGEWYLDERNNKLLYIPRKGEDMDSAVVVVPAVETLLHILGTPDEPVSDVTVEDITFAHATWLRPSLMGHAPLQAGMYMTEAYKIKPQIQRPNGDHKLDNQGWVGRPASAIYAQCCEGVTIADCTVEHCASTAIDFDAYTHGCTVNNCNISDCGGTGILFGSFGTEALEAHRTYDPMDRREVCRRMTVSRNVITNVTNEDWGTLGICAGYVRDALIEGNEVSEVSYTGISIGWGWNQQPCAMANNKVVGNRIHHYARHLYDCAGIYTLGSQPHSLIKNNTVSDIYTPPYAHDPNHWFYLYTDEGSSGIQVIDNIVPSDKFLKNSCGPGNEWVNNGPQSE